jgi:hypothetical protein
VSEKFRIEKKSNFTIVSNDILMNNFMSMKATCLLMKKPCPQRHRFKVVRRGCKLG